jgi:hypothetical protein
VDPNELNSQLAVSRGEHPPSAPLTDLSREQRKDLRRVVFDPQLLLHYEDLTRKFRQALSSGQAGLLPPPLQPWSEREQARAAELLSNAERWTYARYLWNRWDALIEGEPVPAEPQTGLPVDVRRALRKLLRDRRSTLYLMHLAPLKSTQGVPPSTDAAMRSSKA